jgi:carboxymethylenebutenolidase
MSNETDLVAAPVESIATKPLRRRSVVSAMVAVPIATSAVAGFAAPAMAAPTATATTIDPADRRLSTFKGRYALANGKIVDGYFASPRGKTKLNVVLVMPKGETLDAEAENEARHHALAGYLAIVPDLKATSGASSLAGRDAMIADMMTAMPGLKRMAHGNGHVRVVGVQA